MFDYSSDDAPMYMPAPGMPLSHITALVQHLHISGPPLGRSVQMDYSNVSTFFLRLEPRCSRNSGKLNFGVGTVERVDVVGGKQEGYLESERYLFRPGEESPLGS